MSHEFSTSTSDRGDEDARLDAAMARGDDLLIGSLQALERRRRRTQLLWITGGLAMVTAICLLIASISNQPTGEKQTAAAPVVLAAAPAEKPSAQRNPERAVTLTQEGWQLWQQQQLVPAVEKFTAALELDPDNTNALNGLGWARLNGGEPGPAREAFERLLKLEPKHAAALNGLGQIALAERDYAAAEKHLLKAAPTAPAAWYGLSRVYLLTGKYDQATKWLRKIAASGEKDPNVAAMLAAAKAKELPAGLRQQIEPPEISEAAKRVAEGWRLMNQGRAADAKASFEDALAAAPEDAAALNGLGWLLLNGNDPSGAAAYFERGLKSDAQAAGAMNGLGRARYLSGDVEGAIAVWEAMVEKIPGIHAGTANLADAYLETERFDQAAPLLEQLAAAEPNNAQFKEKLARAKAKPAP